MEVSVEQLQGQVQVTVLHVRGDIDIRSYQEIEAVGRAALDGGADHLLIDLSSVPYVSSAGLRAIHSLYTMLNGTSTSMGEEDLSRGLRDGTYKSKHLKLLKPTAQVQEVLRTTGFDMFLEIHRDLGEAVASF